MARRKTRRKTTRKRKTKRKTTKRKTKRKPKRRKRKAPKKVFGGMKIKPDAALAKIIGKTAIPPSKMTKKIWQYIKRKKLMKK
ncbi:hypothetical protein GF374_01980 [Candidatus Woesearchaeota archaeon]|nr:hypothetical protein [Candidatus Woesearchaeota archaeon]